MVKLCFRPNDMKSNPARNTQLMCKNKPIEICNGVRIRDLCLGPHDRELSIICIALALSSQQSHEVLHDFYLIFILE